MGWRARDHRKVVSFSRDYRKPPRFNMGLPAKSRRRRVGGAKRWSLALFLIVLLGLPVGDGINAMVKSYPACRVLSLVDGDTVKMYCPTTGMESGRLLGFDTPEFNGKCLSENWAALRATFYLRARLWRASEIRATPRDLDRYGRRLTLLSLDGVNAAEIMVKAGHARPYAGGKRGGWC